MMVAFITTRLYSEDNETLSSLSGPIVCSFCKVVVGPYVLVDTLLDTD